MLLTLLGGRFFKLDDKEPAEGSMLLTLLGGRIFFSNLVSDMADGVDVTNSAWGPNFFSKLVKKGSMLLTLLGVRLFFQVGLLHDGRGRCY
jgi:hypothetical protein